MIDAEWDSWQSNWRGAAGPLPDVRARARSEVRLHRLGGVGFFGLIAVALATLVPVFADPSPAVRRIGWIIIAFCFAMSIGYVAIHRVPWPGKAGNPREALAFLERRLRVEQRTAHLVRWVYAALFAAFWFVFPGVVAGHEAPRLEMAISGAWMLMVLAVTFSAPWWVARRNRRYAKEIAEWRSWMDEQAL
jgi:threonine/homoserine/homoserine lactone efflux protein